MTGFWWSNGHLAAADSAILGGDPIMQIKSVAEYVHSIGKDVLPSPTPYAVINGSDKFILPNGDYEAAMMRAEMPNASMMLNKPLPMQKQSELKTKKKSKSISMR